MSVIDYAVPACSIHSIDHYALAVPDLAIAERFFNAFGLLVERTAEGLSLRTAHSPHI